MTKTLVGTPDPPPQPGWLSWYATNTTTHTYTATTTNHTNWTWTQ